MIQNYIGTFPQWIRMVLFVTDFPKINKKLWSTTSCWWKYNFCWKKFQKISSYQSHPYFMWKSSDHPSIKYFYAVLLQTHSFYFLSRTWEYNFLTGHHSETKSESSDSVAFVRIVWYFCRVTYLQQLSLLSVVSFPG